MELQPAEQRRRQQRHEARRAILDATETLLLEVGTERFSIRRLAERCGYTAPTIYHHFGDKNHLIDAVLEERFDKLLRRLQRVPRGDDPVAYVRELARAFVRFGLQNPTHYQLLTAPRLEAIPTHAGARDLVEHAFERLAADGWLGGLEVELAFQATWALLHGLISLRIIRPNHRWARHLPEAAIDALLAGMLREAPEEAP